ncbi:MAG: hypothetical protein K0Q90_4704, partial [Paenibacillaceae bacterium]|nr:hypothetical protein [Paenibacillaceae bacterium]
ANHFRQEMMEMFLSAAATLKKEEEYGADSI